MQSPVAIIEVPGSPFLLRFAAGAAALLAAESLNGGRRLPIRRSLPATPSLDPRFNHINVVQSPGTSTYKALLLTFGKRFSNGVQCDFNYTLGKGIDDAPLTSTLAVQGDSGDEAGDENSSAAASQPDKSRQGAGRAGRIQ